MLHVWFYYYKGTHGRKKYFDGGSGYYDKDALQAYQAAEQYCAEDDDDGEMERKTGTKYFNVCVYITKDNDADVKDNGDGSQTVTFNPKNVIYHQDTRTGKFYENEKVLIELGALQVWTIYPNKKSA